MNPESRIQRHLRWPSGRSGRFARLAAIAAIILVYATTLPACGGVVAVGAAAYTALKSGGKRRSPIPLPTVTQILGTAGGTLTLPTTQGATVTVDVPAGTLDTGTIVTIGEASPETFDFDTALLVAPAFTLTFSDSSGAVVSPVRTIAAASTGQPRNLSVFATVSLPKTAPTTAYLDASAIDLARRKQAQVPIRQESSSTYELELPAGGKNLVLAQDLARHPEFTNKPRLETFRHLGREQGDFDDAPLGTRMPVILVHGINLDDNLIRGTPKNGVPKSLDPWLFEYKKQVWSALYTQAVTRDAGFFDRYRFYEFIYPTFLSAKESGAALVELIDIDAKKQFENKDFMIVAHSMGGLVARFAMNTMGSKGHRFGERVRSAITLGTPHHGSIGASLMWIETESAKNSTALDVRRFWAEVGFGAYLGIRYYLPVKNNPGYRSLLWDNFDNGVPASWQTNLGVKLNTAQDGVDLLEFNKRDAYKGKLWCVAGGPLQSTSLSDVTPLQLVSASNHTLLQVSAGVVDQFGLCNPDATEPNYASSDGMVPYESARFEENGQLKPGRDFPGVDHEQLYLDSGVLNAVLDQLSGPTGVTAQAGDSQVTVSWTESSGATSYNLYYRATSGVTKANGTQVAVSGATAYTKTGLTNGTTYYFVVTAVNSAGESGVSAEISATPVVQGVGVTWTVDTTPYLGGSPAIAVDSLGQVHIAVARYTHGLRYVTNAGGQWSEVQVDTAEVGLAQSVAIDSSGKVHIAYGDNVRGEVKYSTNASGSWRTESIEVARPGTTSAGWQGAASLAVSATGNAHIVYYDEINKRVRYASNASGQWVITTIESGQVAGSVTRQAPSIVVDTANRVHVSYVIAGSLGLLRYATNNSGSWQVESVDTGGWALGHSAIAVDSTGAPHIAYGFRPQASYAGYEVRHAVRVGGQWHITTIDGNSSGGAVSYSISIGIGSGDKARVVFGAIDLSHNPPEAVVRYALDNGSGWDVSTIDAVDWDASMALSGSGGVHVALGNDPSPSGMLRYARLVLSGGGGTGLTLLGTNVHGYERYRNDKEGSVLVKLPGGSFTMGSAPGVGFRDERPARTVTLSPFYMGEAEITWGQWAAYVAANPGAYNPSKGFTVTDNDPVHNVSWNDVQLYLTWAGLALPTEAQWEYSARADRNGDTYATSDGTISHNLANYSQNEGITAGTLDQYGYTSPVKAFPANGSGFFDMSGNLWEWCSDWYGSGFYSTSRVSDPAGPTTGAGRVIRGGSWSNYSGGLRVAARNDRAPGDRGIYVGFRPAKSAP